MNKIKSTYLIIVQAALFLLFLLVTSWFNRFAADDYYFIGELKTNSFQEIYQRLYFQWHGRWSSNFLLLAFLEFKNSPYFLFIYFLFSYSFLLFGINRLLNQINYKLKLKITQKEVILYSCIALGVLFFCTINPNETWFWYTSSVVYFWSSIAFIFAVSSYLKQQKTISDYFICIISLIYIGGSNEPLTAFIGLILIYNLIKNKRLLKNINIVGLAILIIAFLLNYMSPGTLNRDEITPSLGIVNWLLYIGYGSIKYLFFTCYKTFIPALFFVVPFYFLGKQNKNQHLLFKPIKQLLLSILGIGIVVIINQTIVITALGGLSPDRAQISASLFIAFIIIRYTFLLGISHHQKSFLPNYILILNIIGLLIFNVLFFKIHQTFSKKYDDRILKITKASKQNIIEVTPLPFSGFIYHPELKNDTNYFVNQHLKSGLGISHKLVLKE